MSRVSDRADLRRTHSTDAVAYISGAAHVLFDCYVAAFLLSDYRAPATKLYVYVSFVVSVSSACEYSDGGQPPLGFPVELLLTSGLKHGLPGESVLGSLTKALIREICCTRLLLWRRRLCPVHELLQDPGPVSGKDCLLGGSFGPRPTAHSSARLYPEATGFSNAIAQYFAAFDIASSWIGGGLPWRVVALLVWASRC